VAHLSAELIRLYSQPSKLSTNMPWEAVVGLGSNVGGKINTGQDDRGK